MANCAYCSQSEITEVSRASLWIDMIAKGASAVRLYSEMRSLEEFGVRAFAKALMDPEERPPASELDRMCPLCRRGFVSRRSGDSIWPDAVIRVLGFARTYLELRGTEQGFGIRELATVVVEGDDVQIQEPVSEEPPPRRKRRKRRRPEQTEQAADPDVVTDTPWDYEQDLFDSP
jgi:hypothetical protein